MDQEATCPDQQQSIPPLQKRHGRGILPDRANLVINYQKLERMDRPLDLFCFSFTNMKGKQEKNQVNFQRVILDQEAICPLDMSTGPVLFFFQKYESKITGKKLSQFSVGDFITYSVLISYCFALHPYEKHELIKPEWVLY